MAVATISSKGQVTLPKQVRDAMGVGPGDRLDFVRMEDGNFAILAATVPVRSLKGLIAAPPTPVSLEEMDRVIADTAGG